jgi:hypothetical protein
MTEEQTPTPAQSGQVTAVIALLILILAVAATHTWMSFQTPPQAKWEYKIGSESDVTLESTINKLGLEGWELVFARRVSVGEIDLMSRAKPEFRYEMIFRRQLPPLPKKF